MSGIGRAPPFPSELSSQDRMLVTSLTLNVEGSVWDRGVRSREMSGTTAAAAAGLTAAAHEHQTEEETGEQAVKRKGCASKRPFGKCSCLCLCQWLTGFSLKYIVTCTESLTRIQTVCTR